MKPIDLAIFILFPLQAFTQILNIEQERIRTDTTGLSGNARVSFDLVQNQKQAFTFNGRAHLQFKTPRDLVLLLGDCSLIRAGGSDFSNTGFAHLRFNRRLSRPFTVEAFVQAQSNRILEVRFRGLAGAGLRARALKSERFRLYAAALPMFEYEELEQVPFHHRDLRLSTYASWTWKASDWISVVHTVYVQPLFRDPADFRVASQADLVMHLSDAFSLALVVAYQTDSRPPPGVVRAVYSYRNVVSFDFGR
jgi:hypothetical protein